MERFDLLINNFEALNNELKIVTNQLKKENKDVFNSIVENSPNFIAIVQDGKYVFINSFGLRLLQCKSSADVIGKDVKETIDAEYHSTLKERLTFKSNEPNKPIYIKVRRMDGSTFFSESNSIPFTYVNKPAALIIGRDVTAEIEQKLEIEREQKLRTDILNAFKEVIAFYSPRHEVIWLNDAGKKELNITDESYIGKRCYKLWFKSNKPCATCPAVHSHFEPTERIVTFADSRTWKIKNTPLYKNNNELAGFIEFREEITEEMMKEKKQKQVAADALYLNQKNTILSEIESVLYKTLSNKKLSKYRSDFKKIFNIIDSYKQLDKDWKMLIVNFEEVYPGFFKKLNDTYPLLSPNDIKHCACIKMNFDTKEIARFFNIKASSVQISRVRLKKKMNLPDSTDLRNFLLNF